MNWVHMLIVCIVHLTFLRFCNLLQKSKWEFKLDVCYLYTMNIHARRAREAKGEKVRSTENSIFP